MLTCRCFIATLLALPLAGRAQTAASVPRFFAGAGVSFGGYPTAEFRGVHVFSFVPTVGVQLSPRLALQASGAYNRDHTYTSFTYEPTYPNYATTRRDSRDQTLVVPVLARFALLPRAARRFQADVLGGASLVRVTVRSDVSPLDGTLQPVSTTQESTSTTSACFTLGAGLRYALLPRLDVTAEFETNYRPTQRAFGNLSGGLRYRFGPQL